MNTHTPDTLTQAGELLRRFSKGERIAVITIGDTDRDPAALLASLLYAQAVELRRIGDLLEVLAAKGTPQQPQPDTERIDRIARGMLE